MLFHIVLSFFTIYLFFRSYEYHSTLNHYAAIARFFPLEYDDFSREIAFMPPHILNIVITKF
ncbi:MAG: hypothetical protein A2022_00065 [Deltaproteobacteria bacterium GWF2_42_12]|nr:MAG: hypothetical protein A2022_00065 [Deltaproteobacteria bacterium GWF2_42_12]OGQ67279.1 MAG: hypothetical protein A3F88_03805 [Deltaproteobacteria bacterium RIFCSPLOWO2_12_FULL_42_16]